ncbi:MAG: hypothetical protein MI976_08215 [Pseudomonadales bacterium]|nr:hypothetical protein [Pseudomonadales bacterium]
MAYLIIFFAMVLVIGPVLWLRPSKRERELAAMRQQAMLTGAKVHPMNIRRDPVYSRILERNPHLGDDTWVRYQWIAKEDEIGPDIKDSWIQRKDKEQGLVWEPRSIKSSENETIEAILNRWRENSDGRFLALELGPRNVAIVWNERADSEELKRMCALARAFFLRKT